MTAENAYGRSRTLRRRHLQMIALGGAIGAGLFVGGGVVVQSAGPAAVLSFALTVLGYLAVVWRRRFGRPAGLLRADSPARAPAPGPRWSR
jgi:GABA permease